MLQNVAFMFVTFIITKLKYKCAVEIIMPKTTITMDAWKCSRCPHIWPNKRDKKPIRCPGCGSPYWDIPLKQKEGLIDGS